MAEAAGAAAPPSLEQASGWIGYDLDDAGGDRIGRVEGLFADAQSGGPAWLVVAVELPRRLRRRSKAIAVSPRECAAMPGRVWTAQERRELRDAPAIDPGRPLLREHELMICAHYGIGEQAGRHAEVAGRPEGAETARPV